MKKIFFLILMILVCTSCISKKNISNSEVSEIKSIIENRKLNVIYRGIENQLTIVVPNTDSINVTGFGFSSEDKYKVSEIQLSKKGENLYTIIPSGGTKIELKISGYAKGKELIEKREFRILNIAHPHTSINGQIIEMKMTKENLAESKIEMLIPQLIFELPKIKTFQYKINNGEFQFVNGNTFDLLAKEKISNIQKGDAVFIYYAETGLKINASLKSLKQLKILIE